MKNRTTINVYTLSNRASKYMKNSEEKKEIDNTVKRF